MAPLFLLWALASAFAQSIDEVAPVRTQTGVPRFTDPAVEDPSAMPALLARLLHGAESSEVRVALVDAIVRSGGDWGAPLAARFPHEADPQVRRMIAEVMRRAEATPARQVLLLASRDPEPAVRAAAMRAIGGRADGTLYASQVGAGLQDADAAVRAYAARAAGWQNLSQDWTPLSALLTDPDPQVRLQALRALERLDPTALRTLPALHALVADPDPQVAHAARGLGAPG